MSVEGWKAVREQVELIATEVVKQQRTRDVIYGLHQKGLLTEAQVAQLKSLNTKTEQVRRLVYELVTASCIGGDDGSSGRNLSVFLEILEEQGMGKLVRHLDPSGAHSPLGPGEDICTFPNLKLTPYHHQQPQEWTGGAEGTNFPFDQLPTLPKPGQDITNNNRNNNGLTANNNEDETTDITDTTTIGAALPDTPTITATLPDTPTSLPPSPRGPLEIHVVPSREIGGKQYRPNEVYKNESEPRGLVFLANYKDFNDQQHETRGGSEIDVKNLMLLFAQMGYRTSTHINMTKWETIQELRKFRSSEELERVDSCVVVFMSHGRDDTSFFTSDNQHLTVHNIVEDFNNRHCPTLKGKPKIFIFQFCRGTGPDIGVDAAPRLVANSGLNAETDSSSFGEVLRDPTFTDMYIVYSTVRGFVSFRHPERGSWLVEAICEVFMKDACNTELETLMKKVSRRVRMNFSQEGNKQACEFVQRAFDRHFFFNPRNLKNMREPGKELDTKEEAEQVLLDTVIHEMFA